MKNLAKNYNVLSTAPDGQNLVIDNFNAYSKPTVKVVKHRLKNDPAYNSYNKIRVQQNFN